MSEPAYVAATRRAYDTVAADYADLLRDELGGKPLDRALLAAFAELVRLGGGGPVADVGCGPGYITGHLDELGLDVFGIDVSPQMVAIARRKYPHLRFRVGTMTALELPDHAMAGLLAWYSLIHTPPSQLPAVVAELARVLRPAGQLLTAFQVGDERVRVDRAYGHDVSIDAYRLPLDRVAGLLEAAGLAVEARVLRAPRGREKVPQGYLMASKPGDQRPNDSH